MNKIALLLLVFITGCSTNTSVSLPKQNTISKTDSISLETWKDASVAAALSVGFGSLLLHDLDSSFKFTNEGSFGNDTKYAGMDKLGHSWYSSTLSYILYDRMISREVEEVEARTAALKAAGISMGIMTLIEVADGFAANSTGFSSEDLLADALGVSFSLARNIYPEIQKKVDFRMEYLPDLSADKWSTENFYSDQKYLLAWKLAGFDALAAGPLRYLELHTGYYARGYSALEEKRSVEKERNLYVGLGLNLAEIFLTHRNKKSQPEDISRGILEHYQVPYTSIETTDNLN